MTQPPVPIPFQLPTAPTPPNADPGLFTWLFYGFPKVGKTTLAHHFPDAIFLATEEGQSALSVSKVSIDSWDTMLQACNALQRGGHSFKTIVVDTVDNLFELCRTHVIKKRKIEHEAELQYGLGHGLVQTEFFRVLNMLAALPYGLVLISHAAEKEVSSPAEKWLRVQPSFRIKKDEDHTRLLGMADFIVYLTMDIRWDSQGNQMEVRQLRTRPAKSYWSGSRFPLTDPLPIDYDALMADFERAFGEVTANQGHFPVSQTSQDTPPATQVAAEGTNAQESAQVSTPAIEGPHPGAKATKPPKGGKPKA